MFTKSTTLNYTRETLLSIYLLFNGIHMQANQQTKKAHNTNYVMHTTYALGCVTLPVNFPKTNQFSLCVVYFGILLSGWILCLRVSHPKHAILIAQCDDIALNILNQLDYKRFESTSKRLVLFIPLIPTYLRGVRYLHRLSQYLLNYYLSR